MKYNSMWNLTVRGKRAISDVSSLLSSSPGNESKSQIVLVVGSGVDISLRNRPNWETLIYTLSINSGISITKSDILRKYAKEWSMEAAEALKSQIGLEKYWKALRDFVKTDIPLSNHPIKNGICNLIKSGVRLIISLNYTNDLIYAIRDEFKYKTKIKIIDRSQLAAWNYQRLLFPPEDTIHIIYIHGNIDEGETGEPTALLDRKGYDSAVYLSSYYYELWKRIFFDFSIISVGTSWKDIFIRNAAADVLSQTPISARQHYALMPDEKGYINLWNDRGMVSSYNVRPIYYSPNLRHREAGVILREISEDHYPINLTDKLNNQSVIDLAHKLDRLGDYESAVQSDWMASNWRQLIKNIYLFENKKLTAETWLSLAKIERHLRHFLWFYLSSEERNITREKLWMIISSLWFSLDDDEKEKLWNPERLSKYKINSEKQNSYLSDNDRGVLEFCIGVYEICNRNPNNKSIVAYWNNLFSQLENNKESLLGSRLKLAQILWGNQNNEKCLLPELRKMATESRWEGIEAKIVLDIFQNEFIFEVNNNNKLPREWGDSKKRHFIPLYIDAYSISKIAGCFRREVGSVIQASFFLSLQESDRSLIAIYERFLENSGRSKELTMIWWIYIGFLAIFCEQRQLSYRWQDAIEWLNYRCGKVIFPSKEGIEAIVNNSLPFWQSFHPRATGIAEEILFNSNRIIK